MIRVSSAGHMTSGYARLKRRPVLRFRVFGGGGGGGRRRRRAAAAGGGGGGGGEPSTFARGFVCLLPAFVAAEVCDHVRLTLQLRDVWARWSAEGERDASASDRELIRSSFFQLLFCNYHFIFLFCFFILFSLRRVPGPPH